jgi:hypothetical protein
VQNASAAFNAVSTQMGTIATVLLVALWVHAIVIGGRQSNPTARTCAVASGALLAAVIVCSAGALPVGRPLQPTWIVTLGVLIGLAEARPEPATRPPATSA